jgi:hypothetical protein
VSIVSDRRRFIEVSGVAAAGAIATAAMTQQKAEAQTATACLVYGFPLAGVLLSARDIGTDRALRAPSYRNTSKTGSTWASFNPSLPSGGFSCRKPCDIVAYG